MHFHVTNVFFWDQWTSYMYVCLSNMTHLIIFIHQIHFLTLYLNEHQDKWANMSYDNHLVMNTIVKSFKNCHNNTMYVNIHAYFYRIINLFIIIHYLPHVLCLKSKKWYFLVNINWSRAAKRIYKIKINS